MITVRQAEYRAYLASPVWKAKRAEALAHHGCICNRCKDYGNDVHHKTYERVGGGELMEDLEVLCRDCHEVHHEIDKMAMTREPGRRTIHRRAIYNKLTATHCRILFTKYKHIKTGNDLFIAINKPHKNEVARDAAYLLGCELLTEKEGAGFAQFQQSHHNKMKMIPKKLLDKPYKVVPWCFPVKKVKSEAIRSPRDNPE